MNRKHAFAAALIITIFIFFLVSSGLTGYLVLDEEESQFFLPEEKQKSFYRLESLIIEPGILLEKDYNNEVEIT